MSSILDALNKLEQEKLAQQASSSDDEFTGSPEKAAAELFGRRSVRAGRRSALFHPWAPLLGALLLGIAITFIAVFVVFRFVSTPNQTVAAVPVAEKAPDLVHTYSMPVKANDANVLKNEGAAAAHKAQPERTTVSPPEKEAQPRKPDVPKPDLPERVAMVPEPVVPPPVPEPKPEPVAPPPILPEPEPEPVVPPPVLPEPEPEPVSPPPVLSEPEPEPVAPPPVLPDPEPVVSDVAVPVPEKEKESPPSGTTGALDQGGAESPKPSSTGTERLAYAQPALPPQPEKRLPAVVAPPVAREEAGPVNIDALPRLSSQDRENLGLNNLQLNVLRPADKNQPDALAIINLKKVYVGEMIPGTSARLIGVEAGAIGVEIDKGGARRQFKISR